MKDKVKNDDIRKKHRLAETQRYNQRTKTKMVGTCRTNGGLQNTSLWELKGYKRKPGRPRINWTNIVKRNLKNMDITWEEAKELAADRTEWRQRVAQCYQQDAG